MKLPCARLFVDPVERDLVPGYYDKIQNPMCLRDIYRKLKDGKYSHLPKDVDSDMRLILKNSCDFNGSAHFISQLCKVLIDQWDKLRRRHLPLPVEQMTQRYCELVIKLDDLLLNHPARPELAAFDAVRTKHNQANIEVTELQKRLSDLKGKEQLIPVLFLVREFDPAYAHGTNELDIDLSRLHPKTLERLKDFVLTTQ